MNSQVLEKNKIYSNRSKKSTSHRYFQIDEVTTDDCFNSTYVGNMTVVSYIKLFATEWENYLLLSEEQFSTRIYIL